MTMRTYVQNIAYKHMSYIVAINLPAVVFLGIYLFIRLWTYVRAFRFLVNLRKGQLSIFCMVQTCRWNSPHFQVIYTSIGHDFIYNIHL